jgi:hypothetical protein
MGLGLAAVPHRKGGVQAAMRSLAPVRARKDSVHAAAAV